MCIQCGCIPDQIGKNCTVPQWDQRGGFPGEGWKGMFQAFKCFATNHVKKSMASMKLLSFIMIIYNDNKNTGNIKSLIPVCDIGFGNILDTMEPCRIRRVKTTSWKITIWKPQYGREKHKIWCQLTSLAASNKRNNLLQLH